MSSVSLLLIGMCIVLLVWVSYVMMTVGPNHMSGDLK